MVFEKSSERVSCNFQQQRPPANIKKPLKKRCKFFLEKISPPMPSIKQPLEQKQLNTHSRLNPLTRRRKNCSPPNCNSFFFQIKPNLSNRMREEEKQHFYSGFFFTKTELVF